MANCCDCRNCFYSDFWEEWECKKNGNIAVDEQGLLDLDIEVYCEFYRKED